MFALAFVCRGWRVYVLLGDVKVTNGERRQASIRVQRAGQAPGKEVDVLLGDSGDVTL